MQMPKTQETVHRMCVSAIKTSICGAIHCLVGFGGAHPKVAENAAKDRYFCMHLIDKFCLTVDLRGQINAMMLQIFFRFFYLVLLLFFV